MHNTPLQHCALLVNVEAIQHFVSVQMFHLPSTLRWGWRLLCGHLVAVQGIAKPPLLYY